MKNLNDRISTLYWEPYDYTPEDNEEYLRYYCEVYDRKYEYLCRHCITEILADRDRWDYEAEIDNVKYTTSRVFKEVFGSEDAFTFEPKEDYHFYGLEWFFDIDELNTAVQEKFYELIDNLEELKPLQEAGIYLEQDLSEVEDMEDYHNTIHWHSDEEDEEDIVQKTLTEELGKKLLALREKCENELCEQVDKAVKKIAEELGLEVC